MRKLITALLTAAVLVGTVLPLSAAEGAKGKKPAKKEGATKSAVKKKRDTYPYRGTVGKVDKSSITLKQKNGERTIVVSDDAKVTIDGKKGKLVDIKAGDYVTGSVKKTDGKEVAVSVYKKDKPTPKKKKPAAGDK